MGPQEFAQAEYREYRAYSELAKHEKDEGFKRILEHLVQHEKEHFEFWKSLSKNKEFSVSPLTILKYRAIRKVLGITFFVKLLERDEKEAVRKYKEYRDTLTDEPHREMINKIIEDEEKHEREVIENIKEGKVEFMGSIILGMNDGLIELTGALVGFTSAFNNNDIVLMSGFITGISASLSMASSAYMQEKHDQDKNPKKSALYTGVSYVIVVLLMIAPFTFPVPPFTSLLITFAIVFSIVAGISYYTSVIHEWSFKKQFAEMLTFSVGVALIAYLIGLGFRAVTGIEI